MKLKIFTLLISFNSFADTVNNKYIYSIDSKSYNKSIIVIDNKDLIVDNMPKCGSSHGLSIELKPTQNLCNKGASSYVFINNGIYNWNCSIFEQIQECSANQLINTSQYSSCKDMLEAYPQLLGQDGVYSAIVGGLNSTLYCNMTDQGGGWTLVLAQFENDYLNNWNEGIQSDYDPSLITKKSFTLNSSQIPSHSMIAISQSEIRNKSISFYFNTQYSTGDISLKVINDNNGLSYHIHRSSNSHYNNHNPEHGTIYYSPSTPHNTLTIDKFGGQFFTYSYSPNYSDSKIRGFGYEGDRTRIDDNGAWLLFVK